MFRKLYLAKYHHKNCKKVRVDLSLYFRLIPTSTEQYKLGHIRQIAIWNFSAVNSLRSKSCNLSLVILDKLLFALSKPLFGNIRKFHRQTYGHTYIQSERQTDRPAGPTHYLLSLLAGE